MNRLGLAITGLVSLTGAALAATPAPNSPSGACFDVVANGPDAQANGPILLNRCTGATWLLVRTPIMESNGTDEGNFTYMWEPLGVGNQQPILSIGLPKLPTVPKK
jgi:hypothetical protein